MDLLIVENEPELTRICDDELDDVAPRRLFVSTLPEALKAVKESPPRLVLSDAKIERIDALTLLETIHVTAERAPPFILASEAHEIDEKLALDRGATAFLKKPVSGDQLRELVRRFLADGGRSKRRFKRLQLLTKAEVGLLN